MAREPREQLVLDLLQQNWQTDHPFGLTPKISYGWFNEDQETTQVTIGQPDEGPIGGGETGFDGIDTTGGSPHQTRGGTVEAHCWARHGDLGNATTSNPREYLTGSAASDGTVSGGVIEEIYDIAQANAVRPVNPVTGNTPVQLLSAGTAAPAPEPDTRGLFHFVVPLNYIYSTA